MKRLFLSVFGFLLILVGIIGWLLPILPGWPFIFLGLSFIAPSFAAKLKRRVLRRFSKKEIVYLEDWRKLKVHTGFTTRHFPLVLHHTDDLSESSNQTAFEKLLTESRVLLSHQALLGSKFIYLNQVHGDKIAVLDDVSPFKNNGFYRLPETDGVLTHRSDLTLLVMTADCLSIFFSAGKQDRHWVGVVHAGWKGTQKEIAKQAFCLIQQRSQCDPSEVRVTFGPRISKKKYEVGPEFKEYFPMNKKTGHSPVFLKNDKIYFDLAGENQRQLISAGAKPDHIQDLEICTVSENDDYYSFRKEKDGAGRIVSFIKKYS